MLVRRGPSVETRLRGLERTVQALASVGPHLWAGGADRRLVRWSGEGSLEPDRDLNEGADIFGLAVTPDARFLVAGLGDGSATVRALPEGELVARLVPLRDGGGVTLLADGSVFAQGDDAKRLRFEEPAKRRVFALGERLAPSVRPPTLTRLADGAVQVRTTVVSPEGPPRVRLDGAATLRSVYPSKSVLEAYDVAFELYDPRGGRHALTALTPGAAPIERPFVLAPDPRLDPDKRTRALLVGNDDYEVAAKLPGVKQGLRAMRDFLAGDEGWKLTDDRIETARNLRGDALRETVRRFFTSAEAAGKTLLFYYSGHGDTEGGEGYLVPTNGALSRLDKGLRASDLWAMIAASPASNVLVILDACKSGTFGLPPSVQRAAEGSQKVALLSATGASKAAPISPDGSAFTRALLEALRDPNNIDLEVLAVTPRLALHAASLAKGARTRAAHVRLVGGSQPAPRPARPQSA